MTKNSAGGGGGREAQEQEGGRAGQEARRPGTGLGLGELHPSSPGCELAPRFHHGLHAWVHRERGSIGRVAEHFNCHVASDIEPHKQPP